LMKWFGGEDLGASPWSLGFKPWWLCVLSYVMCIYIDVSCINMIYETCMMTMNIFKIYILKIHIYIYIYIVNIKSRHAVRNLQSLTEKTKTLKNLKRVNPCHTTLGPHNIHVNFLKLQIT
jgi:hypothetical protein